MEKNNTTYILGAGFNQCIKDINGLKPPLSTNFFNTILKNKSYNYLNNKIEIVYEYIYKYWKKSKENLIYDDFDLEECFTLLQLQLFDAYNSNNQVLINKLLRINSTLKFMFIENLCEFEYFSKSSDLLLNFASLIYKKSSNIITFNYDRNLEKAIEAISHNKWKSFLSYGVKFDTIRICSNNNFKPYTENNYSSNSISSWNILKLHGSLNWFKCIYENNYSLFKNYKSSASYKKTKFILDDDYKYFNTQTDEDLIIDPLIIPPVLYKDYSQDIISTLWSKAQEILSCCKNLIIIGYSFPPTDFGIKKLLLESFEFNTLDNLIIVNPNTSLVNTAKNLTHYNKPVLVCNNLEEFLKSFK
ncbi:SIR2-like domain-containing protein [Clostridium pasteurianum DSM 525 = ATCC 6013]|uniref:SIR2-like domain-containing protein n=1 Tax=Clostridium pasteurianum DSM 525 = ATCC 6013 TaxID=1262449 RepID=A0A0H3IXJ3_CLOPA|nr:SIR2 family protein [Clostridium pasteurianum]AJA46186.1 SIR2-like domain-containing protein [Clostridium pasteurianum DSM 525 = ATCC 6013]AJA50174.1 SIR2-like domain-containing protein [Clostridium pasteurianum DSM 525 = ATCC 6013]AOZ73645.1 hypothetical protein AQ983_00325 [Clostridium pasteurianum DSM 525 = ATCC 6013]AOZ77442.1 hypothetical protein AQ984_00325 [Clostridium pasteurianum]ELP57443.1 hypothetical protein F502_19649 [Clostridium pasteurianum DSM 525 = ATCC 6013]